VKKQVVPKSVLFASCRQQTNKQTIHTQLVNKLKTNKLMKSFLEYTLLVNV